MDSFLAELWNVRGGSSPRASLHDRRRLGRRDRWSAR